MVFAGTMACFIDCGSQTSLRLQEEPEALRPQAKLIAAVARADQSETKLQIAAIAESEKQAQLQVATLPAPS